MIAVGLKRCVLCGSRRNTQASSWRPDPHLLADDALCEPCHGNFSRQVPAVGRIPVYAKSKMRLIRAMQAVLVFLWVLLEMLVKEMRSEAGR